MDRIEIPVTIGNAKVGMNVRRGPDWIYSRQDYVYGKPNVGVITDVFPSTSEDYGWCVVDWGSDDSYSNMNNYRIGFIHPEDPQSTPKHDLIIDFLSDEELNEYLEKQIQTAEKINSWLNED